MCHFTHYSSSWFSCLPVGEFQFGIHWNLFAIVQATIIDGYDNSIATNIICTNDYLFYWCIYVPICLNGSIIYVLNYIYNHIFCTWIGLNILLEITKENWLLQVGVILYLLGVPLAPPIKSVETVSFIMIVAHFIVNNILRKYLVSRVAANVLWKM